MNFEHQKGQMLIEAMVAISILTVGVFGMLNLLNRSLGSNVIVTSQYIGSNLAMEGVEVVKNLIDSNVLQSKWNQDLANGYYEIQYNTLLPLGPKICTSINNPCVPSNYIKLDSTTGIGIYSNIGNDTPFRRIIRIENVSLDEIKVNSIVSWKIKGGNHEINVEDHFFNWRKVEIESPIEP